MSAFNDQYFATSDRPVKVRMCDHPGCNQAGDYRAPKSRDRLNEYYFFCMEHVREYNKAWDFFSGLSPEEIEAYTRDATVWERPSWPMGRWGDAEKSLRDKAMRYVFGEEAVPNFTAPPPSVPPAEREAFLTLGLEHTATFDAIKARYRELVKKHHPDVNGNEKSNEDRFKAIVQAFAVLKQSKQK